MSIARSQDLQRYSSVQVTMTLHRLSVAKIFMDFAESRALVRRTRELVYNLVLATTELLLL
jgi:hypothetical protein